MLRSTFRLALPFALGWTLFVHAQDAGMVLRTSVGYRTQRATLSLGDEQKRQADDLARQAQQANRAGQYGDAMRYYAHGTAVMRQIPWTPAFELASSLQGRLDHAMVEPGKAVTLTLTPLFRSESAAGVKMSLSLFLEPGDKSLGTSLALDPAALPFTTRVTLPETQSGDYALEVRLTSPGEAPPAAARSAYVKAVPMHIEALSGAARQLRERLEKAAAKKDPALPTAGYALSLYDRADSGEINPARYHFREEFTAANAILDAVEAARDPFARHGDLRKAYRSTVDNSLQPYRLFIPDSYDGARPSPLVVALHGMGGDENSMFDSYGGTLKREAARLGFLVVCPKGRDSASMYRGSAEKDVMDVLAEVRRDYRVDANRIYLMGHSMGAYGTWSVAMDYPDVFAALGPISGGGDPAGMVKLRAIPQYVVHGDDDRTVPVTQSRTMVEAGKAAGANITYVEVPGGSHVSVAAPNFAPMLDFFARQARSH